MCYGVSGIIREKSRIDGGTSRRLSIYALETKTN